MFLCAVVGWFFWPRDDSIETAACVADAIPGYARGDAVDITVTVEDGLPLTTVRVDGVVRGADRVMPCDRALTRLELEAGTRYTKLEPHAERGDRAVLEHSLVVAVRYLISIQGRRYAVVGLPGGLALVRY